MRIAIFLSTRSHRKHAQIRTSVSRDAVPRTRVGLASEALDRSNDGGRALTHCGPIDR